MAFDNVEPAGRAAPGLPDRCFILKCPFWIDPLWTFGRWLRRKVRFSLRSMFIACACVSVGLAVAHFATKDYRRRLTISNDILAHGARYANVSADDSITVLFTGPVASSEIEKYRRINRIEFKGTRIDSDSLKNLTGLEHIETLMFTGCSIDGPDQLVPLSELGDVRCVLFWNTPVTDAAIDIIANTPGMEVVLFKNTSVTPAGADRLRGLRPGTAVHLRP
jgi:hypothetical protein